MNRANLVFAIGLIACFLLAPLNLKLAGFSLTLQSLVLLTTAAMLRADRALLLAALYLLAGALGLPVFGGFNGGWEKLTGPTAGFLWTLLPACWYLAWAVRRGQQSFFHYIIYFFRAHLIIIIPGLVILYLLLPGVMIWGTLVRLLPGILFKTIAGGLLLWQIKKLLSREG